MTSLGGVLTPTIVLRVLATVLTISVSALRASAAQTPRIILLKLADGKLDEEFTSIDFVRELTDRRVLMADARERRLVIADFGSGVVQPVSRSGNGPGEFRSIGGLFALGADTTLLVDDANHRWLLLSGTRVVSTLPPDAPPIVSAHGGEEGADRIGHLLAQINVGGIPGDPTGRLDSPYVALVDRRTGKADTLARIRPALRHQVAATKASDGSLASARYSFAPLTGFEQAALFPDGWLAIARLDPYRVEWRPPNGKWIRGGPIPDPSVRVDEQEKRAWIARAFGGRGTPPDPGTINNWPAVIPPFDRSLDPAVLAAPDGALLVRRTPSARHEETRYDVVDRLGTRVGQLLLAKSQHIVGFGPRAVFVVVTDGDGIQRLQRHPWP